MCMLVCAHRRQCCVSAFHCQWWAHRIEGTMVCTGTAAFMVCSSQMAKNGAKGLVRRRTSLVLCQCVLKSTCMPTRWATVLTRKHQVMSPDPGNCTQTIASWCIFECKLDAVTSGAPLMWLSAVMTQRNAECWDICRSPCREVLPPEGQVKPPHGNFNTTAIQQDNWTKRNLWFLENELTNFHQCNKRQGIKKKKRPMFGYCLVSQWSGNGRSGSKGQSLHVVLMSARCFLSFLPLDGNNGVCVCVCPMMDFGPVQGVFPRKHWWEILKYRYLLV